MTETRRLINQLRETIIEHRRLVEWSKARRTEAQQVNPSFSYNVIGAKVTNVNPKIKSDVDSTIGNSKISI